MFMPFRVFFNVVFSAVFIDFADGNLLLLRMPHFANKPFLSNRGFAYLALLTAIVIIGISTSAVVRYWSNISLREKEKELLFRGDQYRTAIERYVKANSAFPQSIDDLLQDKRTPVMKRHLRQKYKDPISGEDFMEIRDPLTHRINGVYSPSDKEPLKKANFPEQDQDFEGKTKYGEWQFVYKLPPRQPGTIPGQPGTTAGLPGTTTGQPGTIAGQSGVTSGGTGLRPSNKPPIQNPIQSGPGQ
jgi:type II secretory pathway pseudopilin PulG